MIEIDLIVFRMSWGKEWSGGRGLSLKLIPLELAAVYTRGGLASLYTESCFDQSHHHFILVSLGSCFFMSSQVYSRLRAQICWINHLLAKASLFKERAKGILLCLHRENNSEGGVYKTDARMWRQASFGFGLEELLYFSFRGVWAWRVCIHRLARKLGEIFQRGEAATAGCLRIHVSFYTKPNIQIEIIIFEPFQSFSLRISADIVQGFTPDKIFICYHICCHI